MGASCAGCCKCTCCADPCCANCCVPRPTKVSADDSANDQVEAQLLQERMIDLFRFKILLLGAGESGKSTVVKQLKLLHNKKLDNAELNLVATSLHQNVIDCMRALIHAAEDFKYELSDEDKQVADTILKYEDGRLIDYQFGQQIIKLYSSDPIRKTYKRRNEFWLLDACDYYLKHLERFTEINFKPTDEDCVMCRIRTTGIVESFLEEKRTEVGPNEPASIVYQVVDVGGQRNERKKWIHCFSDVKAILFIVSLAGYDQVLFEDPMKNRMVEALELFKDIVNKPMFAETPIFLFLNKKDLFESMIKERPISVLFEDFKGGSDIHASLEHVRSKFRAVVPPNKDVSIFEVTTLYKRDIKYAFEDVKKALLEINKRALENEAATVAKKQAKLDKRIAHSSSNAESS